MICLPFIPDQIDFIVSDEHVINSRYNLIYDMNSPDFPQYKPFNKDFGPPSLSQMFVFFKLVNRTFLPENKLVALLCSSNPQKITNCLFYLISYHLIALKKPLDECIQLYQDVLNLSVQYRDASQTERSLYDLSIISCLKGLEKAFKLQLFETNQFYIMTYNNYYKMENGYLNWIVPNKLLAFPSPTDFIEHHGSLPLSSYFMSLFKVFGIKNVIRLCESTYDKNVFIKAGIKFHEFFMEDGESPTIEFVESIMNLLESTEKFAIHCKAGLGRTYVLGERFISPFFY